MERTGEQLESERQRELLDALGPVVTRVPWTEYRRGLWESSYLKSRSQTGVGFSKSLAFELTAAGLFDQVPAMAKPVVATTPFTSLDALTRELQITRTAPGNRLPGSVVSAVVGRQILLPSDASRSETDLLKEAVLVTTKDSDYRNARANLHARLADFSRDGFTDLVSLRAAVKAMNDALAEMERAVRKRQIWVWAHRVFSFSQIALGAVVAPINPILPCLGCHRNRGVDNQRVAGRLERPRSKGSRHRDAARRET